MTLESQYAIHSSLKQELDKIPPNSLTLDELLQFLQSQEKRDNSGNIVVYPLHWREEKKKSKNSDTGYRYIRTVRAQHQTVMSQWLRYGASVLQDVCASVSGVNTISDLLEALLYPYVATFLDVLREEKLITESDMTVIPPNRFKDLIADKLTIATQFAIISKMDRKVPQLRINELLTKRYEGTMYYREDDSNITPTLIYDLVSKMPIQQQISVARGLQQQYL